MLSTVTKHKLIHIHAVCVCVSVFINPSTQSCVVVVVVICLSLEKQPKSLIRPVALHFTEGSLFFVFVCVVLPQLTAAAAWRYVHPSPDIVAPWTCPGIYCASR